MSGPGFLSTRALLGAAVVGLVGAAGMFIYEQLYAEKRRAMLVRDLARLNTQVSTMKLELENLKELQKQVSAKRGKHRRPTKPSAKRSAESSKVVTPEQADKVFVPQNSTGPSKSVANGPQLAGDETDYSTDFQSVVGTDYDVSSEEFYDVHTESELDSDSETPRNSPAPLEPVDPVLTEVDRLIDIGGAEQLRAAHAILCNEGLRLAGAIGVGASTNLPILLRQAQCCHRLAAETVGETRDQWIKRGMESCERALLLDSTNKQSRQLLALLLGDQRASNHV